MQLIKRGAEADIYRTEWFGRDAVLKTRSPKPYRNTELDARLRRRRTIREADMLHLVKSLGIYSPLIYFVNTEKYTIVMQYIAAKPIHSLDNDEILSHCGSMGQIAGLLHSAGIMHGDLTTSNFLYNDNLYLIDMGLSSRTTKPEDWAVDMRLIKEIFNSAHADIIDEAWDKLVAGYSKTMPQWKRVLKITSDIERRGRYARVV
ncbi:MAG: Kae1-associated serine/threonine protein kinase [Cenarchaeum sp. SB0662_bin_33]|nr:Kae1-associated serine/threonine protein kinase [Cenarchaeum sp. SB0664_bin_35]MYB47525.1 Kae1-associated serine/threonine protein kinase [Cenarchaeum sp. SB0662_bin_33]